MKTNENNAGNEYFYAESIVVKGCVGSYLNQSLLDGSYYMSEKKESSTARTRFTQEELQDVNGVNVWESNEWVKLDTKGGN